MNLFKSLMGKVWQDPNAAEVVKISTGQLYLARPGNIRSSRECIYPEAMATIRRVPSLEHNFELVITRVYEEGEAELLDDSDETDEERTFLIDAELEFRTTETEGEPTFIWRDMRGDVDEFYEYVASGTNRPTKAFFETCMYRAMYERRYRQNGDSLSDKELEEFIWKPEAKKAPPRRKASKQTSQDASAPPSPAPPKGKGKGGVGVSDPTVVLFKSPAELYIWIKPERIDGDGSFELQGEFNAQIMQVEGQHKYWLAALTPEDDRILLAHEINASMNEKWSSQMTSVTWNKVDDNDVDMTSWLFRFPGPEPYNSFLENFTIAAWETKFQTPWSKIKADEKAYVMSSNLDEDYEMGNAEDEEEDEEDQIQSDLEATTDSDEEDEVYDEDSEDDEARAPRGDGVKNSLLTVGYNGDRSFVVRGANIGVFRRDTDGNKGVKYVATMSNITTPKGKSFVPKQVMLHEQDAKMILMNPTDPHALYSMDVERAKVVEEWKIHDDITVDHIAPDNKFAPTTVEKTLVGASHNALFRIDPRVSGKKLVDSQYKQYASKNKFSGVATTAAGKLAVASEKGDIRLFDSIGKNAKTALPPLGDPIIGIDTTADGRYIVATTKTYLLLIDTLIGEGRYAGQLGFDRSFPADAKPLPRRLQLRGEHVAFMNHDVSFSPARFNQGEGQTENAIVTSTGKYIIAWDFGKVKKGMLDRYEIKLYEDQVVQDSFRFGDDKEIVVALQNDVYGVNKKSLKRPTRASLAGQLQNARSNSNIVNSPW
ncbi:VID27 cytoplasmic protein [Cylindrobasidium torrendii FP15055 ss-10]|uniref:VID27 cytoplasmic protein n=1 Tax=Cylindrobasidium torrendii FP15055 ss-10 TaxID=1314674 RepID=A0A0D7BUG5_9AGAR|nr:VID27 cytoplasmic protein [Cylindrobasidium torrendii FP15055 ss-10]